MNRYIQIILAVVIFILGLIIGIFLKDIPYFKWNTEIQVDEVLNAFIALSLAIIIPFWITKWADDSKGIKQFLIEEISLISNEVDKIKNKIEDCYKSGNITEQNKKEINIIFEYLDKRVDSLRNQLNLTYKVKSKDDIQELGNANSTFWKAITGGNFMTNSFQKVDDAFWKNTITAYFTYESTIKMMAHKINKY